MISRRTALARTAQALAAGAAAAAGIGCEDDAAPPGATVVPLWFAYGGKNREELLRLVDGFHRAQSDVRIHAVYQGDYFECLAKLRTALAAGTAPPLTHVVGEVVPYLADAGVLEPFDRFLDPAALDVVPALGQAGTFVGGAERPLWALPFNRSTPIAYLDGRVLEELGVAPPATWDELADFARRAVRRSADGTVTRWGFSCPVDWWFWVALVGQAGGAVFDGAGAATLGGDAGVRALAFWQRLVHEDRTMKPPPGRDYNAWQTANTDFLGGRAAMIWTSTAFLRYLEDNAKFPVVAAPLPRAERFAVPTGGTMFVLPKGAPPGAHRGAAAFVRWMLEPAQANQWATRTGYLPVSRGGLAALERDGFYEAHPNDRVAVAQLDAATPWPWAPDLFRVQREVVQPRLEEAVLGPTDARAALDAARATARRP